jgi:hypothetical protein
MNLFSQHIAASFYLIIESPYEKHAALRIRQAPNISLVRGLPCTKI